MVKHNNQAVLEQFRAELEKQDLIHDGDSIGTDDETLLYVFYLSCDTAALCARSLAQR